MERRAVSSGFVTTAIQGGSSSQEDLDDIVKGWRAFVEDDDAWFGLLHEEIICQK